MRVASLFRPTLVVAALGCGSAAPRGDDPPAVPLVELGPATPAIERSPAPIVREPKDDGAACIQTLLAGGRPSAAPAADEALFRRAIAAAELGDTADARKRLLELTNDHPHSRFVALAFVWFGDMFAAEAGSAVDALPFYREAMKYPVPANDAFAYAALRAAELHQGREEHADALADFRRAITAAMGEAPCGAALAARARRGLVASYAVVGAPGKAFTFFQPLSGDASGASTATVGMMIALATQLADEHPADAATVVNDLLKRAPATTSCDDLHRLVDGRPALRSRVAAALDRRCAKHAAP